MEHWKQNPHLSPLPQGEADKKIRHACFSPLPLGEEAAKRQVRVLSALICVVLAVVFFGCENANYVPMVTPKMISSRSSKQHVDFSMLERGRTLFVHRCIECHTLPVLWHYTSEDWIKIVNSMSHRASLKPAEREAIVAYILAVKAGKE